MSGRRLTVIQLIPALEAGGAERSTLEVARALVAAGHRSIVVSTGGRMVAQLVREGSEHVSMPVAAKSLRTFAQVPKLRALLRELQPDIVHARSRMPAWLARFALSAAPRAHFVTTAHGLNSPGFYSSIMARGERVICVSNTVRDHLLRHYRFADPQRLVVIPRGIDPDAYPYGWQSDNYWREWFFAEFPHLAGAPLLTLPGRGTRLKATPTQSASSPTSRRARSRAPAPARRAPDRTRGLRRGTGKTRRRTRRRQLGRVERAARRHARRLRCVRADPATVEQTRIVRPHRD
jgi:glycosyltransferase involved in cell wall biosynthesis